MRMRYGVHPILEEEANEILRQSLAGVTSHEAKRDVLTPWKEKDRRSREVYASSGSVDPAIRRGQFHRVANKTAPHLNSIEGVAPSMGRTRGRVAARDTGISLARFVEDNSA